MLLQNLQKLGSQKTVDENLNVYRPLRDYFRNINVRLK